MDMAALSRERYVARWARRSTRLATTCCFRFASGHPMEQSKWCSKCLRRLARPRGVEPLTPRSVVGCLVSRLQAPDRFSPSHIARRPERAFAGSCSALDSLSWP